MTVYLVAYMISPKRGSEPGMSWNWAWHLAQSVKVRVIAYPFFREETESALATNGRSRPELHWLTLGSSGHALFNRGAWGKALHHYLWLRRVREYLRELLTEKSEHALIHHVGWASVSLPPPFLGLGAPVIWGPVGGGQRVPLALLGLLGGEAVKEVLRNFRVTVLPFFPSWRNAVRGFDLVLATNRATLNLLAQGGARDARLFLADGVPVEFGKPYFSRGEAHRELTLLWAGRFIPIKAPSLALSALKQVSFPVRLLMAGDGPLLPQMREMAFRLGLQDKVTFLGRVPFERMPELYQEADAFLFTSARDSFGAQVLEAMSFGLPVVVPDHQGVRDFVPEDAGIKVPVRNVPSLVSGLAQGISRLAQDPALRMQMGEKAWHFALQERWDRKANRMLQIYEEVLSRKKD